MAIQQQTTDGSEDEWEFYATSDKSEFDVNESVNPSDFGFA